MLGFCVFPFVVSLSGFPFVVSLSNHAALKRLKREVLLFVRRTWFDKLTTNGVKKVGFFLALTRCFFPRFPRSHAPHGNAFWTRFLPLLKRNAFLKPLTNPRRFCQMSLTNRFQTSFVAKTKRSKSLTNN